MSPDIRIVRCALTHQLMRGLSLKSWPSPWGVLYVRPGCEHDERLIRHGRCHLRQMASDGWWLFYALYLYWLVRLGHDGNPYEIEALDAETPSKGFA